MALLPLQNFIDQVGPRISSLWLNIIDQLSYTVFDRAQTKLDARTALFEDAPLEVSNGGTGSRGSGVTFLAFLTTFFPFIWQYLNPQNAIELAQGFSITDYSFVAGHPMRMGANGNDTGNDWQAVNWAAIYSGLTGKPMPMDDGYVYRLTQDLVMPVPVAQGAPIATVRGSRFYPTIHFDTGSNFGIVVLGTGATTAGVTSSAYNYSPSMWNLGVKVTSGGYGFFFNSLNHPDVRGSWVYGGGNQASAFYFLNCLVPNTKGTLSTGMGSIASGSYEFDRCTDTEIDQARVSGGGARGGLLIDRCTNTTIVSFSGESCGIPIRICSKAESALPNTCTKLLSAELENPGGGNPYVEVGSGLTGTALALATELCFFGSPSGGPYVIPAGVVAQNFVGLKIRSGTHFTLSTGPTAAFQLLGTNYSGFEIEPLRNMKSLGVPWVFANGAQIKAAGPEVHFQLGLFNGANPVCQSRGFVGGQAVTALSGTNPSILRDAVMGGYYEFVPVANGGATTMTLSDVAEGMAFELYAADSNTTLQAGTGPGQFILATGFAGTMTSGHSYRFRGNAAGACSQIN